MTQIVNDFDFVETGWNGLVSSKSWIAQEIQDFESIAFGKKAGKWNHSLLFQRTENGSLWAVEMTEKGMIKTPICDYIKLQAAKDCEILILKPKFTYSQNKCIDIIEQNVGKIHYQFINLLFYQAVHMASGWWWGGKGTTKRMICGELVAYIYYQLTGLKCFKKWNEAAPSEFYLNELFDKFLYQPLKKQ